MRRKIPVEEHCGPLHAMGCPHSVRIWRGKSYANVVDDCNGCKYFIDVEYGDEGIEFVICDGEGNPPDEDLMDCPPYTEE